MAVYKRDYTIANQVFNLYIIIDTLNNIWFKAKEIAVVLNYSDVKNAYKHVEEMNKTTWMTIRQNTPHCRGGIDTSSWHPTTVFINESGLYQLILRSKKEEAVQFQQWVTNEVLPSIRKNGHYLMTSEIIDGTSSSAAAAAAAANTSCDIFATINSSVDTAMSADCNIVAGPTFEAHQKQIQTLEYNVMSYKNQFLESKIKLIEAENQLVCVTSDKEKQIACIKTDSEKQIACFKSNFEKQIAKITAEQDVVVRSLQEQVKDTQHASQIEIANYKVDNERLRSLAEKSVMEYALYAMMAKDSNEQNDLLRNTLKRLAPRIAPEMSENPQREHYIVIYRYTQNSTTYFKIIRAQLAHVETYDKRIRKYQFPSSDRSKLRKNELWLLSAVQIFKECCANSIAFWNKFKVENRDFIYGVQFTNTIALTFTFLNEEDLRAKYKMDKRNSDLAINTDEDQIPTETLTFNTLDFIDEDDAVRRCLTPFLMTTLDLKKRFRHLIDEIRAESDDAGTSKRIREDYTAPEIFGYLKENPIGSNVMSLEN